MERTVSAMEARKKFGELLNRIHLRGEEIVIERAGKRIAKMIPVGQQPSSSLGKLDFRKAAGLGKEVWVSMNTDKYVRQERDEWD